MTELRHPSRSAEKVRSLELPNVSPDLFVGNEAILELQNMGSDERFIVALCGMGADEFEAYGPMEWDEFDEWEAAHNAAYGEDSDDPTDKCPGPHNRVILRTTEGYLYE
jgi:hypothetical protein